MCRYPYKLDGIFIIAQQKVQAFNHLRYHMFTWEDTQDPNGSAKHAHASTHPGSPLPAVFLDLRKPRGTRACASKVLH